MFKLDETLQKDTFLIADFDLSKLLLMNNSNYPWLILVPKIANLVEFNDLEFNQQLILVKEINFVSKILQEKYNPHKLNIAMLGNMVRQLHIHIIARFENDAAFPKPVWGGESKNYDDLTAYKLVNELRQICKDKIW